MISSFKETLSKSLIYSIVMILISAIVWTNAAIAVDIDKTTRTVPLNTSGEEITLTTKQLAVGQRKFNGSCSSCHIAGGTKTNPDVDLSAQMLVSATPPRNNIESLVDYLANPTTYDGLESLEELHPSTSRSDLFPIMGDLTEEDLTAISGYILVQPKIIGDQWAGGKPRR